MTKIQINTRKINQIYLFVQDFNYNVIKINHWFILLILYQNSNHIYFHKNILLRFFQTKKFGVKYHRKTKRKVSLLYANLFLLYNTTLTCPIRKPSKPFLESVRVWMIALTILYFNFSNDHFHLHSNLISSLLLYFLSSFLFLSRSNTDINSFYFLSLLHFNSFIY